jgi:Family of unknown function (DUF6518)
MTGSSTRRVAEVLAAAALFGVVMSVFKGNGAGTRSDIGNLSAPWLIVPFLAAAAASNGRIVRGVVIGVAASLIALAGFYVTNSVVLDLGPHPWLDDLRLAVGGGRYWFRLALLSGPVFGALGALWRRSNSRVIGVLVFALLIGEPLAEWALLHHNVGLFEFSTYNPAVWIGEAVIGVVACLIVARGVRRQASV